MVSFSSGNGRHFNVFQGMKGFVSPKGAVTFSIISLTTISASKQAGGQFFIKKAMFHLLCAPYSHFHSSQIILTIVSHFLHSNLLPLTQETLTWIQRRKSRTYSLEETSEDDGETAQSITNIPEQEYNMRFTEFIQIREFNGRGCFSLTMSLSFHIFHKLSTLVS